MSRFYFAVALLTLMGVHESIVAALGGFTISPVFVFVLVALSPFLMLLSNGLPSLFSLLPVAATEGPLPQLTVNTTTKSPIDLDALTAAMVLAMSRSTVPPRPAVTPAPALAAPAPGMPAGFTTAAFPQPSSSTRREQR
jgi:hypothetical protein